MCQTKGSRREASAFFEPLLFALGSNTSCFRTIGICDHGNHANENEIAEQVTKVDVRPRILQMLKTSQDGIDIVKTNFVEHESRRKGTKQKPESIVKPLPLSNLTQSPPDWVSCALAVHQPPAHFPFAIK